MKSYILMTLHLIILMTMIGCKEENNIHPFGSDVEPGSPGMVADVEVKNIAGGAIISYQLPDNSDIMYVKARYLVGKNRKMESRASVYCNQLTVAGFGDMNKHEVELVCVDRMENEGSPTKTIVNPLKPAVISTYESLDVQPTFGGIYVNFKNLERASLSIHVITTDSLNQSYEAYVQYTQAKEGPFYVHGFDAEDRIFDIYVMDRWGNTSDTLHTMQTPFKESLLNKKLFNTYFLPNDVACNAWGGNLANAWNDDFTPTAYVHSAGGDDTFPMWFTFDIGGVAKLSRYKFYPLNMKEHAFNRGNLKKWEIWGRADTPSADGSWEGWTKLMECESHKPSGSPIGQNTAEDLAVLENGEDFIFPGEIPSVRYIRFKIFETWGGINFIHFAEFTFWGNVESNK